MKISMPDDKWGFQNGIPIEPRKWQQSAMPVLISHYSKPNPSRSVVFAATGSGKALVISQLCACIQCDPDEVIVVSTSRQKLVRQLRNTIEDRLESGEFMAPKVVGAYFADSKDGLDDRKVIVACNDSMGNLADALASQGKHCAMLLVDELHNSENKTMISAYEKLGPSRSCGFSATPYLSNIKRGISTFDEVLITYSIQNALEDGVVVPWKIVGWDGGETDLDTACLEMMKEQTQGRGLVNAVSIDDAEQFAKRACDEGYPIKAIHSRRSNRENEDIIQEMVSGKIKAIVHVDLVTEGADIRELSFLCMRRVVSSRNRFVQEIGRGIRSYTSPITGEVKTHLVILDPNDQMGVHKMSHPACLSGDFDPDDIDIENEPEGKKIERLLQQECFDLMRHLTKVRAGKDVLSSSPLASYLSQLCSVFDTFGLMDKPINSRDWRSAPATEKQVTSMENMKWAVGMKVVPSLHQTALKALTEHGTKMTRGIASDLISIQLSLADKKQWPKFSQLDQCVKDGLERHAKRKSRPVTTPKAILQTPQGPKLEQGVLFEGMNRK